MKIGIISDTHGFIDPNVKKHFEDCSEIWHAGDIGSLHILDELQNMCTLRSVYGNIDDRPIQLACSEYLAFTCEEMNVLLLHIAGKPHVYTSATNALIQKHKPDLLVCGHSHIVRVAKDTKYPNLIYINPGAAGHEGFHQKRTLIKMKIEKRKILQMQVIELGKRGQL